MAQHRLQLYRCPNHGLMEGTAAAGREVPTCPVHMDDGARCGNPLDGPLVGWLGPTSLEVLAQGLERLSSPGPVGCRLRRKRIAREEAEIRANLDHGRD